jgi:hypothetical protein
VGRQGRTPGLAHARNQRGAGYRALPLLNAGRRRADEKKPAYAGLKKLLGVSLRDVSQAGLYRCNMKAA